MLLLKKNNTKYSFTREHYWLNLLQTQILSRIKSIGGHNYANQNNLPMGNFLPQPIKSAKQYLSEHTKYVDESLRFVLVATATGIVTYIFRKELGEWYTNHLLSEKYKRSEGAKKLLEPRKIEEKYNYITREELEEMMNGIVGTIEDEKYIILVGEKGSGKTTLLNHVMNGKEGIVFVKIDGETTFANLKHKLLESIGVHIEEWNQNKV